ncbi:MAG: flavodoxin family protein [Termitinemataceae bacterium]|nr:MAG: flavodoxin family protein [Termitinemataceae bacterium]
MNVIAFNGSPHKDGVINTSLELIAEELRGAGIDVEIAQIGGESIHGCTGCGACRGKGICRIDNDCVNDYRKKINSSDGIVLGSPVYYGGIAGTFKSFLDRLFYPGQNLFWKAGASVASCRRTGTMATFQQLNNYLTLAGIVITPTVYWNVIHGNNKTEAAEDAEGVYTMRAVGKNMAWLIKALNAAKQTSTPPELGPKVRTNFIRI